NAAAAQEPDRHQQEERPAHEMHRTASSHLTLESKRGAQEGEEAGQETESEARAVQKPGADGGADRRAPPRPDRADQTEEPALRLGAARRLRRRGRAAA